MDVNIVVFHKIYVLFYIHEKDSNVLVSSRFLDCNALLVSAQTCKRDIFIFLLSIHQQFQYIFATDNYCNDENNKVGCNWDGGACCNNHNDGWDNFCTECKCLGK